MTAAETVAEYTNFDSTEGEYCAIPEDKNASFLASLQKTDMGKTGLKRFFIRELEAAGKEDGYDNLIIFYLGFSEALFGKTFYYKPVLILDENRIYIQCSPRGGREHNFYNGQWNPKIYPKKA